MTKTYQIAIGTDINSVTNFAKLLFSRCLSFSYDYEQGTVTVSDMAGVDVKKINQFLASQVFKNIKEA